MLAEIIDNRILLGLIVLAGMIPIAALVTILVDWTDKIFPSEEVPGMYTLIFILALVLVALEFKVLGIA